MNGVDEPSPPRTLWRSVKYIRIVRAAMGWWAMRRPAGWTEEQHIANHRVNVGGHYAEEILAECCADMAKQQRAKKKRK